MAKMYILDQNLLTDTPEIRVGEKIYAVDNRQKTVKKIYEITRNMSGDDYHPLMNSILELAVGTTAAKEIDDMDMPYPAYQQLFELVMSAVTGEEIEAADQAKSGK